MNEPQDVKKNGISTTKSRDIASAMASLIQDAQIYLLYKDGWDCVDQNCPEEEYLTLLRKSEEDLKELGVKMAWFDSYDDIDRDISAYERLKEIIVDIKEGNFTVVYEQ